jgi:hypothetical protein
MLIGASGVGKYLWRRPMSPTSAHLLCFVASSIVRRMPLSRTQQPAADLFWAAGVSCSVLAHFAVFCRQQHSSPHAIESHSATGGGPILGSRRGGR